MQLNGRLQYIFNSLWRSFPLDNRFTLGTPVITFLNTSRIFLLFVCFCISIFLWIYLLITDCIVVTVTQNYTVFTRGLFLPASVCVRRYLYQSRACPRDNSWPIELGRGLFQFIAFLHVGQAKDVLNNELKKCEDTFTKILPDQGILSSLKQSEHRKLLLVVAKRNVVNIVIKI